MKTEDISQYNTLSESDKQQYIALKTQHPGWNHKQLMCRIEVYKKLDKHVINPVDDKSETEFMGSIVQRQFLIESIIDVFK